MFYGWGTDHRTKQLDERTVAVCRFRYVSLMFIFQLVWQRRWFLQGRDRAQDRQVTAAEIDEIYGPGSAPSPGLWRRFGLVFSIAAFLAVALVSAAVGAVAGDDDTVAGSGPVADFAGDGQEDREEPVGNLGSEAVVDDERSDVSSVESGDSVEVDSTVDSQAPAEAPDDAAGVVADAAALAGVTGTYGNVKVDVIEIRTSFTEPVDFDPSRPDATDQTGEQRWVYVTVDYESLDPNNWFDFDPEFVRLVIDGQALAPGRDFGRQSFRSEPRSIESFVYGYAYDGPLDLSAMAISISDNTVPLTLPLDGTGAADPYPVSVVAPAPFSYLDGAFQDGCGYRNEMNVTEVFLDLQEPAEWDVSIFGGYKRATAGHRQLIVKGYGERFEAPGCSAAHSDIEADHFRLAIDGRPSGPVAGVVGDKRGQAGDITDFELMWEIPVDAELVELELTGSGGDSATVELSVGEMPSVLGE